MPIYSFEHKETGEEYELEMSYDDLDQYLKDNPHVFQTFRMNLVDPVGIGITKPPSDFQKHVLSRVKQVPGADKNKIEKRWSIPREW
jgi:NH3-dependent NAD+ synthetase